MEPVAGEGADASEPGAARPAEAAERQAGTKWAKVIDHTRCIGCHACTTACKSENQVPLSVTRTYVKAVDVGTFPFARRAFQVTRCNQCEDAPCATACPTTAMFRRPDGIVDFDKSICIGCKACIAACPYDAIFINPEDHAAEKCNFCAHRIDVGLEPACAVVCPTEAILVGDMNDPSSRVARIVGRDPVSVRRPEKETYPKLFYKGAGQATLDPLAARRPEGGLFMWSEQSGARDRVVSGHPGPGPGESPSGGAGPGAAGHAGRAGPHNSSAAALLSYDVPHTLPWDWRVSLYTWTKSIAAGAYLVPLLLALLGAISWTSPLWAWGAPVLGGAFLAGTGGLLVWDLEHPARFYMIFTRPQWRSWLVRGAFVIGGYALVLAGHFAASVAGAADLRTWLAAAGLPLAGLTAAYTAYLLAQARARDLWQNPLLPPHLLVQSIMAGSGALAFVAAGAEPAALGPLLWTFAGASLIHLLLVGGELSLTHRTAHARLAAHEMTRGRYAPWFRASVGLVGLGLLAPLAAAVAPGGGPAPLAALAASGAGLAGLFAFEHAFVQAGQSVPLA